MMGHTYDAAILGAGVAGISMAGALADRGWNTVLIDKQTFPRHKVCGEFLSPESLKFLVDFRLDQLVRSLHPSEMDRVRLTSADGVSLETPLPGTALGVSRYVLDNALLQHAQKKKVVVQTGVKVTGVFPWERGYRINVRHKHGQETIEARAVIGAWGRSAQSALRSNLRSTSHKSFIGIKSHFEGMKAEPVVELYFFPGGYLGISPIEGDYFNVSALLTRSAFYDAGKTVLGAIEKAAYLNLKLGQRLADGKSILGTQAAVATVEPSRKQVAWDLVPHIGDAAAVIPPLCGDGMAMALCSSDLCARLAHRFLRGELSLIEWRQQYTTALHREFSRPLWWGGFVEHLLRNPEMSSLLFRLGRFMPGLAYRIVQATRLRGSDVW